MTITNDALDFLNQSGAPTFPFDTIGATARGKIVAAEKTQQTDFESKKPLFWDDGNPRWQLVITLDTGVADENGETNRRLFAKGNMLKAIRDALKDAGASLEVDGELVVKYTEDGTPPRKGLNAPKLFKAKYTKPTPPSFDVDDL